MNYLKLTIKASWRAQWRHFGVFIVNFEHIFHLVLVFLLWTLSMYFSALCELFYISVIFRFDGFKFYPFLKIFPRSRIFPRSVIHKKADLKQWNGKCISRKCLWWTFFYKQSLFSTQPQCCLKLFHELWFKCCLGVA